MSSKVDWTKVPYNKKLDKADAILRYLENYDYENLNVLMLPKEDAPFLMDILNQYINKTIDDILVDIPENTEITYIYREPETNNKTWFTHILKGPFTSEQSREIIDSMAYEKYWFFYPELVGLPNNGITGAFFEWVDMVPTKEEPTLDMTIEELTNNFKKAYDNFWELNSNIELE